MKEFAKTHWTVEDLKTLRPNWTRADCEAWLECYSGKLVEAMVAAGWDFIIDKLNEEDAYIKK